MTTSSSTQRLVQWLGRHKRFVLVLATIAALNAAYGFDPRFTIINLVWIFISVVKIDYT